MNADFEFNMKTSILLVLLIGPLFCLGQQPASGQNQQSTCEWIPSPGLAAPNRVRIMPMVLPGFTISSPLPKYDEGKGNGSVLLKLDLDQNGGIEDLCVAQSDNGALNEVALGAVRQWKFRPYYLNRKPIEIESAVLLRFANGKIENVPSAAKR